MRRRDRSASAALCLRRLTAPLVLSCRLQRTICHNGARPARATLRISDLATARRSKPAALFRLPSNRRAIKHGLPSGSLIERDHVQSAHASRMLAPAVSGSWHKTSPTGHGGGERLNWSSTADQSGSACQWRFSPLRSPDITNSAMYRRYDCGCVGWKRTSEGRCSTNVTAASAAAVARSSRFPRRCKSAVVHASEGKNLPGDFEIFEVRSN